MVAFNRFRSRILIFLKHPNRRTYAYYYHNVHDIILLLIVMAKRLGTLFFYFPSRGIILY